MFSRWVCLPFPTPTMPLVMNTSYSQFPEYEGKPPHDKRCVLGLPLNPPNALFQSLAQKNIMVRTRIPVIECREKLRFGHEKGE